MKLFFYLTMLISTACAKEGDHQELIVGSPIENEDNIDETEEGPEQETTPEQNCIDYSKCRVIKTNKFTYIKCRRN